MSKVYDVPEITRELFEAKAKRRTFLREEFLKLKTNPFQHASQEGGAVFDPAIQRYNAMKVTNFEHFKPSGRNGLYGMLFLIMPITAYFYVVYTTRHAQEDKFRRGEVAYKDRRFKFI